jgi:pantoate--beta-alanine ligase
MSSRNKYLEGGDRQAALVLSRALNAAKAAYDSGEREAEALRRIMREIISSEPHARAQYVSCADYGSLEELETVTGKALLSMAVTIGKTRLIDNMVLG